jgi:hypothetical protein
MPTKGVGISDGGCLLMGAFGKFKVHKCSTHVMWSDPVISSTDMTIHWNNVEEHFHFLNFSKKTLSCYRVKQEIDK